MLHDPQAPRIFVAEHIDGAGHRLRNILEGMAVAEKNGMNFGGVWAKGPGWFKTEHGHNFRDLVDAFFGGTASKEIFIEQIQNHPAPINFTVKFESVRELEKAHGRFNNLANIFLPSSSEWSYNNSVPVSEYFTPRLLAAFRQQLAKRSLTFAPDQVAVGVHVRRGDLGKKESRALPDKVFFEIVKRIRLLLPLADVHVWSSTWPFWNSSAFDGYRKRNMSVHLDDPTLMDPWAHLSRAKILVSSPSNFAFIAALLNPYCVIDLTESHRIFKNWMNGNDQKRPSYNDELKACIAHANGDR